MHKLAETDISQLLFSGYFRIRILGIAMDGMGWMRSSRRLTANTKVATVLGSIPASSRHSGIWGTADEAVSNKVHFKKYNNKNLPF